MRTDHDRPSPGRPRAKPAWLIACGALGLVPIAVWLHPAVAALLATTAAVVQSRRLAASTRQLEDATARIELFNEHLAHMREALGLKLGLDTAAERARREAAATADPTSSITAAHPAVPRSLRRRDTNLHHVITHELKTPLCAIEELLHILDEGVVGELDSQQREVVAAALDSTTVMRSYIDDLFEMIRIETGRQILECRPCDVQRLLDRAIAAAEQLPQTRGTRLRALVAPDLPLVEIDRRRIDRLLITVLGNALESHGPRDTVTILAGPHRVAGDDGPVRAVRIDITDAPDTVSAEQLSHAFPPVAPLSAEDHALRGGLGLGLSICKEIIERHGGSILAASRPGTGVTFCFTLPAAMPSANVEIQRPTGAATADAEPTILLKP